MSVGVGDRAPDFSLPGTGDRTYTLAEHAGHPVVLVFYPGDDTPVCTKQLNAYNHGLEQFTDLGATVLAISAQDVASHDRFSSKQGGFDFPLLADTDKHVAARVRHVGTTRVPPPERVHRRRRRGDPLCPPRHRRPDLPAGERAGGRAGVALDGEFGAQIVARARCWRFCVSSPARSERFSSSEPTRVPQEYDCHRPRSGTWPMPGRP